MNTALPEGAHRFTKIVLPYVTVLIKTEDEQKVIEMLQRGFRKIEFEQVKND
jgi:hypothetical protein